MKAASRPFKSKYNSGRCPVCKRRISKDALIVMLEKPVTWIESKRLIPRGGGRFFTNQLSSQYAHAECMEDKNVRVTNTKPDAPEKNERERLGT